MASKAQEIRHRIDQIDDLLNRMREAYNEPVKGSGATSPMQDTVDTEPARTSRDGPAHRRLVDPERQYSDNMRIAGLTDPRAFGMTRDGTPVVAKSSQTPTGFEQQAKTTHQAYGAHKGEQALPPGTENIADASLPSWELHGVTGQTVAEAVSFIEGQARNASVSPATTGAVDELKDKRTSDALPAEQRCFDATATKSPPPDLTNPGFTYEEGQSAYDQWVAQHTPGLEVHAGEGKPIADDKYGITVTLAAPHRGKDKK